MYAIAVESQLCQQERKKKVPEGTALVLPVTLLLPAPEFQAHETAHKKSLQQQEANAESIRVDQNQESLLYSSGKKSVVILGSRNLRVH